MAPLHFLINYPKRSGNVRRSADLSESTPDIGATVGIAIGIALVCSFALASFVYYFYTRRKGSMILRARRANWADAMENGMYGQKTLAPKTGFGRVLSVFSPKRRGPRCNQHLRSSHYLPADDSRPRQLPGKEFDDFYEPAVELEGGLVRGNTGLSQTKAACSPGQTEDAHRQVRGNGSAQPTTSASKWERNVDSTRPSGLGDAPLPPPDVNTLIITTQATTDAAGTAAWHRKRTGPPPPLTIEPPGMHSQSPSGPHSAYSTFATAQSPYEYGSINVPSVPPVPSHLPNDGFGARYPYSEEDALHSSGSNRSSHPLQYPPSPETPGSIPSMSRSDSGAQETHPLAPPTPTYSLPRSQPSPQRAAIIEATHFECLGPLPDHIPIPSPPHFRTQHQQPQDPFLTPRIRTPENCVPVGHGNSSNTTASTAGETFHVFTQDPLLHETNPFRHQPSPVHPTFTREHSVHSQGLRDYDLSKTRRESTDSLGSNFTVEEEARIQEQIVRNLDALAKERVTGEMDLVHIPQVSERRYSWED